MEVGQETFRGTFQPQQLSESVRPGDPNNFGQLKCAFLLHVLAATLPLTRSCTETCMATSPLSRQAAKADAADTAVLNPGYQPVWKQAHRQMGSRQSYGSIAQI